MLAFSRRLKRVGGVSVLVRLACVRIAGSFELEVLPVDLHTSPIMNRCQRASCELVVPSNLVKVVPGNLEAACTTVGAGSAGAMYSAH